MNARRETQGFVAIELVLAIGLLFFPVVLLVASLPQWSERQHAAIVAAREAARVAGQAWPADGEAGAERVVREVAATYGISMRDVTVTVSAPPERGGLLTATVTVRMPAISVPLLAGRCLVVDGARVGTHRRLPEPVMRTVRDERGTMTLWVLGLCIAVLFLGGLSLDLWRVIAVRRSLVAMADAGATAGANGLDTVALRNGVLRIDPALARSEASEALQQQSGWSAVDAADVDVVGNTVTVTVQAHVGFSLLGIFVHGDPVEVEATASAEPREEP